MVIGVLGVKLTSSLYVHFFPESASPNLWKAKLRILRVGIYRSRIPDPGIDIITV
jgi:hypothetical protein